MRAAVAFTGWVHLPFQLLGGTTAHFVPLADTRPTSSNANAAFSIRAKLSSLPLHCVL
jgi:hypothetical protein